MAEEISLEEYKKAYGEMCLEAGMDDYMTKPIKREIVFESIKKWVLGETHPAKAFLSS